MHYRDLRDWLEGVNSFGELRVVEGADWNQEIRRGGGGRRAI